MTNITMLAATRPRLLKQALESIGDLSAATVLIRDAYLDRQVYDLLIDWDDGARKVVLCANPEHQLGTGPARNQVISMSAACFGRGDYLYLSDDDVYFLRPHWLKILVEAYRLARPYGYRIVGAYNHPYNQPCEKSWVSVQDGIVEPVYAVATQSMLMDWETWDEFGPFCDTPAGKVCQSEDVDLCNRIRAAGCKVGVISPSLLVNTGITNSFGEHIPGWELVKSQCPEGVICE